MGTAKRLRREAVAAGTAEPFRNAPRRKGATWVCANCHAPLLRGSGITIDGFEYHKDCPKKMVPID